VSKKRRRNKIGLEVFERDGYFMGIIMNKGGTSQLIGSKRLARIIACSICFKKRVTDNQLQMILRQIESSRLEEKNDELDKQLLLETLQMIREAKMEKVETESQIFYVMRHREGSPLAVLFSSN